MIQQLDMQEIDGKDKGNNFDVDELERSVKESIKKKGNKER